MKNRTCTWWWLYGLGLIVLSGCHSISAREIPLSDRVVAYQIEAALDPVAKHIQGKETLRWRNPSDAPVTELQFHLYLNAFRDQKSTFMVESGGQLRGDYLKSGKFGSIDVLSLRTSDGEDLLPRAEFIAPDDGNRDDRTVWRIPLTRPVGPHQEITLSIEFLSKLPRVFARTGYLGNYFLVAQWFPKLGVYEPAGLRRRTTAGWNCHQFHANTEFYADFGTYDVTFVVPETYKVGATGVLQSKESRPGNQTAYRYIQADVHDFAWTASPDFLEFEDTFRHPHLPEVKLKLLLQPAHLAQKDRHLAAVKNSLQYCGLTYGDYPYQTLTIIDPAYQADGSGGMEYPTLITCGTLYRVMDDEALFEASPEVVTTHEFAHQYWYGMVASNEFEESWLDEGFTAFTERKLMDAFYKDQTAIWFRLVGQPIMRLPIRLDVWSFNRVTLTPATVKCDPMMTQSWKYKADDQCEVSYYFNSYPRPALTLEMLERHLGTPTMNRILKTYFERWRFKHPTAQDFFDVASEVAGQNLDWFFQQYFRDTVVLDYAIQSAKTTGTGVQFATEVTVIRKGEAVMPVEVEFRFTDGSRLRETWDGKAAEKRFAIERSAALQSVVVDPDHKLMLDVDWFNNSYVVNPSQVGTVNLVSRLIFLLQEALCFAL